MFRPFIIPAVLSAFVLIGGVIVSVQPVVEPGYVHPIALALTGVFFAICGTAGLAACIAFAFIEKAEAAAARV